MRTMAAKLSVKNVPFTCKSSFNVSGVLPPVTSFPLRIGKNSILFAYWSSAFGIGVDIVVFFSTSS